VGLLVLRLRRGILIGGEETSEVERLFVTTEYMLDKYLIQEASGPLHTSGEVIYSDE
jgi:hypothetical protein